MRFQPSAHSNPTPTKTADDKTATTIKMLAGGLIVVVGLVAMMVVKPAK